MRHRVKTKKFKGSRKQQDMMFRNMASSLIIYEYVETSEPRAKELSKYVSRLITTAKKGTLDSKRKLKAGLTEPNAVEKIQKEIAPRYKERAGGYTRILKVGPRKGDASYQVRIELV